MHIITKPQYHQIRPNIYPVKQSNGDFSTTGLDKQSTKRKKKEEDQNSIEFFKPKPFLTKELIGKLIQSLKKTIGAIQRCDRETLQISYRYRKRKEILKLIYQVLRPLKLSAIILMLCLSIQLLFVFFSVSKWMKSSKLSIVSHLKNKKTCF